MRVEGWFGSGFEDDEVVVTAGADPVARESTVTGATYRFARTEGRWDEMEKAVGTRVENEAAPAVAPEDDEMTRDVLIAVERIRVVDSGKLPQRPPRRHLTDWVMATDDVPESHEVTWAGVGMDAIVYKILPVPAPSSRLCRVTRRDSTTPPPRSERSTIIASW